MSLLKYLKNTIKYLKYVTCCIILVLLALSIQVLYGQNIMATHILTL